VRLIVLLVSNAVAVVALPCKVPINLVNALIVGAINQVLVSVETKLKLAPVPIVSWSVKIIAPR
jgi:hypothetical protein